MRLLRVAAALTLAGLAAACTSSGDPRGSGLAESFDTKNYVRSNDTNGTQRRPDVNRAFTQPSIPSISNRGF
ncbi:hypothetical protein NS228_25030 [Methylobacterium indicum]|uniref:Lipoprotein n=1 Tax=Methylobacterium indicum TaxID=1775910 RepID=A0A0J6RDC4_9HYPH|nr:hypothetical protein [Methylobacterium indicum]KMO19478.1 hypothetical protein QR78_12480 [Methylobacterium indicum]KMO24145.1 hypothetical protein QR79_12185 [Methylobacterium indicum]KTS19557.1 hypothetical protein NS229_25395 [Methylobacterium indicum]KTS28231.1 hypothetical protein NS228_25030 [Methylobacterium indicum]KTS51920.1 hypothetical protein NS230_12550 [Methylobacterium indicum]